MVLRPTHSSLSEDEMRCVCGSETNTHSSLSEDEMEVCEMRGGVCVLLKPTHSSLSEDEMEVCVSGTETNTPLTELSYGCVLLRPLRYHGYLFLKPCSAFL